MLLYCRNATLVLSNTAKLSSYLVSNEAQPHTKAAQAEELEGRPCQTHKPVFVVFASSSPFGSNSFAKGTDFKSLAAFPLVMLCLNAARVWRAAAGVSETRKGFWLCFIRTLGSTFCLGDSWSPPQSNGRQCSGSSIWVALMCSQEEDHEWGWGGLIHKCHNSGQEGKAKSVVDGSPR